MKLFHYLFIILILSGCSNSSNTSETTSKMEDAAPKEWLKMEGDDNKPHVVLVSGDEEYRSEEALPQLAKILSQRHGFNCTVLFSQDPQKPGIVDPNFSHNIPGLEQLASADLMFIFTRFRALPDEQMKYIDDYLMSGKPVVGIRTSTHAFNFKEDFITNYRHYGNYYKEDDEWKDGFGRMVLGEKWISHHGHHGHQSTRGLANPEAAGHPILNGIADGDVWGPTDVYGVRLPLPGDALPLILGQVVNRAGEEDPNDPLLGMRSTDSELPELITQNKKDGEATVIDKNNPMMPVAWTKSYQLPGGKQGRSFTSTIGSSTDLLAEGTRRMVVNAVYWSLGLDVPEKADVELVGAYQPTRFAFHDDAYWDELNTRIEDLD